MEKSGVIVSITGERDLVEPYLKDIGYKLSFISAPDPETGIVQGQADIALELVSHESGIPAELWIFFNSSRDKSRKAFQAINERIEKIKPEWIADRIKALGIAVPPGHRVDLTYSDVSTAESKSGYFISKMLPFILVLMLISGCSFTSIDLIAGEKERGTLETLLTTSVDRRDVIFGKFIIVFMSGIVSVLLNLASMLLSLQFGLISTGTEQFQFTPSYGNILGILACAIPLGLLFAALLMAFSAKAKTFQEGQVMLMPFSLMAMLPAFISTIPGIRSFSFVMIVPIANVAVVIREFLEGNGHATSFLIVNLINLFYSFIALRWAVKFLESDGALVSASQQPLWETSRGVNKLKAAFYAYVSIWLLMFFVASKLQEWNMKIGMFLTQYVLILGAGYLFLKLTKSPVKKTLRFRKAGLPGWLVVLPFTIGMLSLAQWLNYYQMKYLPAPEFLLHYFSDTFSSSELGVIASIFLFCLSPGFCEEFLFRGVLLGTFLEKLKPHHAIILTGFLFGFLHFSIYRFIPTTLLGIGFGYLTYRIGSIFPGMVAHALNNLIAIHLLPELIPDDINTNWFLLGVPLIILSIALLESSYSNGSIGNKNGGKNGIFRWNSGQST